MAGKTCQVDGDCASGFCIDKVCQPPLDCMPGTANCDGIYQSGCNVNTGSDPKNCGACGNVCPANMPRCGNGACTVTMCPNGISFAQSSYMAGSRLLHIGVRDFNKDGRPDLVVADAPAMGAGFLVFFNKGGGAFQAPQLSPSNEPPYSINLGDIDRDGRDDIVSRMPNTGDVGIYLNQGGGMFGNPTRMGSFRQLQMVALADVTNDGFLDIVTLETSINNRVSVFPNDGNGKFNNVVDYPATYTANMTLGDLNSDGKLDVVTSAQAGVSVLLNVNGQFPAHTDYPLQDNSASNLIIADLDGDGKPDVLTSGNSSVGMMPNKGGGVLGATTTLIKIFGWAVVADFDLNGKLDIALLRSNKTISMYLNQGGLVFTGPTVFNVGAIGGFVAADLDGDKKPDLISAGDSTVDVLLNRCF